MSGLEVVASVAAVVGIVASPFFQTFFDSFKNHLIKRFSKAQIKNASSSNEPDQPPLPTSPSELLALEEAMGNIPLLLQLSLSIDNRTGGITKFLIQLREVAYAAEDLLDELHYEDLQLKVLGEEASTSQAEADSLNVAIDAEEGMAAGPAAVQPSPDAGSSSPSSKTSQVGCFPRLKLFFTKRSRDEDITS